MTYLTAKVTRRSQSHSGYHPDRFHPDRFYPDRFIDRIMPRTAGQQGNAADRYRLRSCLAPPFAAADLYRYPLLHAFRDEVQKLGMIGVEVPTTLVP